MVRILQDAFYHAMPGHRIGNNISVGGYQTNFGRYTPGDCFHPNGLSFSNADLADRYEFRLLREPYSDAALHDADILMITNPDYPLYPGASPYRWTPKDVDALLRFVNRGGGVLLLVNSFLSRPDFWEENFDYERVSLLFDRLGVRWDPNYMSDDSTIEPAQAGSFCLGYGQGGRVMGNTLPEGITPLATYKNQIYGFQANLGEGKLVVIGDAGTVSNGLICFPGFDNAAFYKDILERLTPAWCAKGVKRWDHLSYSHISAAPGKRGLSEDLLRSLHPEGEWMVDHHYRHLTWDVLSPSRGDEVWSALPFTLAKIKDQSAATIPLNWISVGGSKPGPRFDLEVKLNALQSRYGTDFHVIGRTWSDKLTWNDLFDQPEAMDVAGRIERVHVVFEMRSRLDAQGRPTAARWSQGQILYARSPKAVHYGYEILLNSKSEVIMPRTGPA